MYSTHTNTHKNTLLLLKALRIVVWMDADCQKQFNTTCIPNQLHRTYV